MTMKGKLDKYIVYDGDETLYFPTLSAISEHYGHSFEWARRIFLDLVKKKPIEIDELFTGE